MGKAKPELSHPATAAKARHLAALVVWAAVGIHIFAGRTNTAQGCDSFGYLQVASAMAERGFLGTLERDPLIPEIYNALGRPPPDRDVYCLMAPHCYYVSDFDRGLVSNNNPPGFPLLLLPWLKLFGPPGAFLFLPCLSLLFLAGFYIFLVRLAGAETALLSAVPLAVHPLFVYHSMDLIADLPSLVLIFLAVFFLLPRKGGPTSTRRGVLLCTASGAAFGFSLLTRYANAAALAPLLYLLMRGGGAGGGEGRGKSRAERIAFCAATLAAGVLPLAVYHYALYGNPLDTTYPPDVEGRMRLGFFPQGLAGYAGIAWRTFGPGLFVMAVGVRRVFWNPPAVSEDSRRYRVFFTASAWAAGAFVVFYSFHVLLDDRYLIPVLPFFFVFYAAGGLAMVRSLARAGRRRLGKTLFGLLLLYPVADALPRYYPPPHMPMERYREAARLVPPDAVVFADTYSGSVRLFGGLRGWRYRWTPEERLHRVIDILLERGVPVWFALDRGEIDERFGRLTGIYALEKAPLTHLGLYRLAARREDYDGPPDGYVEIRRVFVPCGARLAFEGRKARLEGEALICDPRGLGGGERIENGRFVVGREWGGLAFDLAPELVGRGKTVEIAVVMADPAGTLILEPWSADNRNLGGETRSWSGSGSVLAWRVRTGSGGGAGVIRIAPTDGMTHRIKSVEVRTIPDSEGL